MEFKVICSKDKMWLNFLLKRSFAKNSWLVTSHQHPALEFRTCCFDSCKAEMWYIFLCSYFWKSNMTSKTPWIINNETWRLKLCVWTIHLNDKKQEQALYITVSHWEAGKQLSPFCSALVTPEMRNIKLQTYSSSTERTKWRATEITKSWEIRLTHIHWANICSAWNVIASSSWALPLCSRQQPQEQWKEAGSPWPPVVPQLAPAATENQQGVGTCLSYPSARAPGWGSVVATRLLSCCNHLLGVGKPPPLIPRLLSLTAPTACRMETVKR